MKCVERYTERYSTEASNLLTKLTAQADTQSVCSWLCCKSHKLRSVYHVDQTQYEWTVSPNSDYRYFCRSKYYYIQSLKWHYQKNALTAVLILNRAPTAVVFLTHDKKQKCFNYHLLPILSLIANVRHYDQWPQTNAEDDDVHWLWQWWLIS